jgi:hypothetical protein
MRLLIVAWMIAVGVTPQPTVTVEESTHRSASGGICKLASEGTLGVNIGPTAAMPVLALIRTSPSG